MAFRRVSVGLVAAITFLAVPSEVHSKSTASLFELTEQVTEISPAKFSTLAASSVPWVLDCYSPVCAHCMRFKTTWEKVGTALRDSTVQVGAVNCVKYGDLCKTLSVKGVPTLVAINSPDQPRGTSAEPALKVMKKASTHEGIVDDIKAEFPGAVYPAPVVSVAAARVLVQKDAVSAPGKTKEFETEAEMENGGGQGPWQGGAGAPCILRIEDATMSVRFALENEVFTRGPALSKDRMDALVSFLDLLATSFPGKMIRASFRKLATDLRRDRGLNDITSWYKRIKNLDIGGFPPSEEYNWPAANMETGSDENVQHFESGLWSLFHTLSVSSAPMRQSPYLVMEGIHSFMFHFFRCAHCRSHFLEMYENCENGRCVIPEPSNMRGQQTSAGEPALALWVWRAHNAVNTRNAIEADPPMEPHKSLWPSEKACGECWSGFPSGNGKGKGKDQPPWSENEVLKVLQRTFSCPEAVGEGDDAPSRSWAVTCVLVCAGAALVVWVRRWVEMRGIGLNKKRVDAVPS